MWLYSFCVAFLCLLHFANAESQFWGEILPLACKSSCERYFREHDEPDKDCVEFCDFVDILLEDQGVGQALATMSARWGLNLMQWAMRDTVLAIAEGQPKPFVGVMFTTRLDYYEEHMKNSPDLQTREAAKVIEEAQKKRFDEGDEMDDGEVESDSKKKTEL